MPFRCEWDSRSVMPSSLSRRVGQLDITKRVGGESARVASWSKPLRSSTEKGPPFLHLSCWSCYTMASAAHNITSGYFECYWQLFQLWLQVMSLVDGDRRRVRSGDEDVCGPQTLVVKGRGCRGWRYRFKLEVLPGGNDSAIVSGNALS